MTPPAWSPISRRSPPPPNEKCGRSNVQPVKSRATGSRGISGRFVPNAASWWTWANGSTPSTSFPSRSSQNILKNSATCRPANISTNRKRKNETWCKVSGSGTTKQETKKSNETNFFNLAGHHRSDNFLFARRATNDSNQKCYE